MSCKLTHQHREFSCCRNKTTSPCCNQSPQDSIIPYPPNSAQKTGKNVKAPSKRCPHSSFDPTREALNPNLRQIWVRCCSNGRFRGSYARCDPPTPPKCGARGSVDLMFVGFIQFFPICLRIKMSAMGKNIAFRKIQKCLSHCASQPCT